jgi:hypothetical protein
MVERQARFYFRGNEKHKSDFRRVVRSTKEVWML